MSGYDWNEIMDDAGLVAEYVLMKVGGLEGPFVIANPEKLVGGHAVGTGQCAAICQSPKTIQVGHTSTWRAGPNALEARSRIVKGTIIASFICNCYQSMAHDNHVAIFLSATDKSIDVIDQWTGKAPSKRTLYLKPGYTDPSNNARPFHVVYRSKDKVPCPGRFSKKERARIMAIQDDKKRWAELDRITSECLKRTNA